MLTEVMRHYHLRRPPVDVGFFETDHHQQMTRDLIAAIQGGRLIALTAVIAWYLQSPVARVLALVFLPFALFVVAMLALRAG